MIAGIGVGLILRARLGSDGYSTAIYGLSLRTPLPYAVANWTVALTCVLAARTQGVRPGIGTVAHPLIVGSCVDLVLHLAQPTTLILRLIVMTVGTLLLSAGVALYLSACLGSGPFESLVFALPFLPFRAAYIALQAAGTLTGWLLGAPVGLGTVVIVFGVGPLATLIRRPRETT